jgi:hypothetical protein
MSCPHGNHPDACDICDEVAAAYNSGVEHTKQSHEWVGLTDEEAQQAFKRHNCDISKDLAGILARAIGAKLKEKNDL